MGTRIFNSAVVTGATGFIGRWLLVELTRAGVEVTALIRKPDARVAELREWVRAHGGDPERVHAAALDLLADDLGLDARAGDALAGADAVFHLAALFDFGLPLDVARKANVAAALALLERAAHPALQRFVHISGYRTAGGPAQALDVTAPEAIEAYAAVHGAYEASKMEAHPLMAERARELGVPLTRVSPALVIGDSGTGETTQLTGLAETLRLLWRRRLPVLAGSRQTWLPVIAVDVLAKLLARLPADPESEGADIVAFDDRSPTLTRLVGLAAGRMGVPRPRLHLPVGLLRRLPSAVTGVDAEALSFISEDRYDPHPFLAACARLGVDLPHPEAAIARWVDYLVDTRFGEEPSAAGHSVVVGGQPTWMEGDPETARTVFLPGVMLHARSWAPVRAHLNGASVALDPPGMGLSAPSPGAADPDQWLAAALAGARGPQTLVAHSLGTAFAVRYAAAHPERVERLVLVSPFFAQARPRWPYRQAWLMAPLFRFGPSSALLDALAGDSPTTRDALTFLRRPSVARHTARWLAWASSPVVRSDLRATLAELDCPVTLVVGEDDPLLHELPPAVEVVVVPGAGHYPQLTHPALVATGAALAGTSRPSAARTSRPTSAGIPRAADSAENTGPARRAAGSFGPGAGSRSLRRQSPR